MQEREENKQRLNLAIMKIMESKLIDEILIFCATHQISHDDFMHAMLTLIHSDMRAFNISEHNLCDEDGVLLVTVKRIE